MKTLIVGLTGFAGSGKDTAARHLAEALEARQKRTKCLAFADPIRAALMAMGVPHRYMEERDLKEQPVPGLGVSYRHLAQTLGTEWGRQQVDPNLWVSFLEQRLLGLAMVHRLPNVLLLTDVRFQNEADWILQQRGLLVRVERQGVAQVREHISEASVDGVTLVLHNDGDLANLRARCGALSNQLLAHLTLEGFE